MILKDDIKPITYLKANASSVLDYINETHRSVVITQNGEAKAVLQDPESFDKTQQALAMLQLVSQSEQQLKAGKGTPQSDVFSKISDLINEKKV